MKRTILCCLSLFYLCTASTVIAGEELTYRLKWVFNSSVAGDIYAESGGYFEKEGLQVNVKEGGPEKNAIKELELEQADFGVASADQVIRAREKGAKVVVIAQVFQINPMQWIYRDSLPEITNPAQLKGQKIGYTFGGNDESILMNLLDKGGLSKDDIKVTGAHFDFTPFLTGRVDIWPSYRNSQGVILADKLGAEGEGVRFLNPADFGVQFVANSIITSERMIQEQPETVEKFKRALVAAWTAAMDVQNEATVVDAIMERDKGNTKEMCQKQLAVTRDLVAPEGAVVGAIDRAAWKQTEEIMLGAGLIKKAVNIEEALLP